MTGSVTPTVRLVGAAVSIALVAGAGGFGIAHLLDRSGRAPVTQGRDANGRKPLYWYDPMVPSQHFDKPGKSPFMDMQLVAKYPGGSEDDASGVRIDPSAAQRLGLRTAVVRRGDLASSFDVTGTIAFNDRDVAVVQARAAGFVNRVYALAPGDVIAAGSPLADLLVPEWAGAQAEYLAVRHTGNAPLTQAARQRLLLLGMPPGTVAAVERSDRPHTVVTIATPIGGTIKTLGIRAGMSVMAGQTLAEVNGLGTVWLNAAAPEAIAGQLRIGQPVQATLAAFPGETLTGRITAILPETQADSRTLTVRIELSNRGGRLRPGMFASVSLGGRPAPALLVPSEALIRTGKRTLVMLALADGRYRPAEVQVGRESGDSTEIMAGLSEGEKIVASGQFLIDSEASLSGIQARPIRTPGGPPMTTTQPKAYETVGRVEAIERDGITFSHEPVPAIGWPAMTMKFRLGNPALAHGIKRGDRLRFVFDRPPEGPTLRRVMPEAVR